MFFSCRSKEEQSLLKTYENLSAAVIENNAVVISEYAPFLLEEENQGAFQQLQTIYAANPDFSVQITGSGQAFITLSDPLNILLPFVLDDTGKWVLIDTIQKIRYIDVIPATVD